MINEQIIIVHHDSHVIKIQFFYFYFEQSDFSLVGSLIKIIWGVGGKYLTCIVYKAHKSSFDNDFEESVLTQFD